MSKYRRLLLGAILRRVSTVLLILLGIMLIPKDQNPFFVGVVVVFLGALGWGQISQIIDYLSMSKLRFIEQIKWERRK